MKTVFLRALEADDKAATLYRAIHDPKEALGKQRFEVDTATFAAVPRSPFAYWVPVALRNAFERNPSLKCESRFAARGPYTLDDFRFLRLSHEVDPCLVKNARAATIGTRAWVRFLKGGAFSRYYSDPCLAIDWSAEGEALKALVSAYRDSKGWGPNWTAAINGYEYYFRPGLTWTHRTTSALSMRAMPAGCIFSAKGPALIIEDQYERLALLGLCNSQVFQAIFEISLGAADAAARSYDVGIMQRLPIPALDENVKISLCMLARACWHKCRTLSRTVNTSYAFALPALLHVAGDTLTALAAAWAEHVRTVEAEVAVIQAEIDERCFELYDIDQTDRRAITEGFGSLNPSADRVETDEDGDAESENETDDEENAEVGASTTSLTAELVSWAVGVACGRYDVRLATGARALPPEPEPFDPLPICSPAILTGDDGLPLVSAPSNYSLAFPESGILVDDPGHPDDLTSAVRAVFDVVFGARADTIWQEAAALLDPKDQDMRTWLSSSFFEYHIKHYSKSRRKAPILWQLGVPSGRYSVWLYAHRLTRDSFFQLQNDVVLTKLDHEERQLASLIKSAGSSTSARERKELATQEAFVEELRGLLEEVKRIAPLWTPTLEDGVVLTMAPLWRLVPQHKPWQKELKGNWDKLCAGKYDWARLAMHLWPERVVPKCATDRSLAIAHGLAEMFWVQDADGKWQLRATPTRPVDQIVRERSSPAVKAALKTLLEAPVAASGNNRGRRCRTDTVADHGGTR